MTQSQQNPDLNVILIDPDDDTESPVGRLSVASDGRLSVASAEPDNEEALRKFVDEMNARERVLVKLPPPLGSKPFSIYAQTYERSDENFVTGLKHFSLANYGLKLATDEELEKKNAVESSSSPRRHKKK